MELLGEREPFRSRRRRIQELLQTTIQTMSDDQVPPPLPLHLHTIDSLLREIVSGRPVLLGKDDETFAINDEATRAILGWFFEDRNRWSGNANDQDAWAMVEASKSTPTL